MIDKSDTPHGRVYDGCFVGSPVASFSGPQKGSALDTLEYLVVGSEKVPENAFKADTRLLKMARSKFITRTLVLRLVDVPNSPLNKAYWATYHCADALEQRGQALTTKYCGYRWCVTCNRNKAGELMNGYADVIRAFSDPHHLVLTKTTVEGEVLRDEIERMNDAFKRITRKLTRAGLPVKGLRKLECTYNPITGKYHPHFHVLIETYEQGKHFRKEWLSEFGEEADIKCQPLDRADEGGLMELLKYFTKILPSSKASKATGKVEVHPHALDTMFVAMRRKKTIQPFGGLRKLPTKKDKKSDYQIPERDYAIWVWSQEIADYEDFQTSEPLTGYEPDKQTLDFVELVKGSKKISPAGSDARGA